MDDEIKKGTLKVTGVVRGAPMSADRLVHLQNWGDYQLRRIIAAPRRSRDTGDGSMQVEDKVLSERTEEADDMASEVEVDDLAGEQTWPTEEEMRGVGEGSNAGDGPGLKGRRKKVPKGTSAYQAAWLLDDEEIESDEDGDTVSEGSIENEMVRNEKTIPRLNLGNDLGDVEQQGSEKAQQEEDEEEYEDLPEETSNKAVAFEDMDMEEEKRQ